MRTVSILAALAATVGLTNAIAFSNPELNATLTKGTYYDLAWTSVDTDPSTLSVYLVNFVNWPPYYQQLALNEEVSAGEVSVRIPCDVDDSYGYQFNAINGTNVYIIYAQTDKFFINGTSCSDPATTTATCPAAATVTQTVTVRASSSSSSLSSSSSPIAGVARVQLVANAHAKANANATITATAALSEATTTGASSSGLVSATCPSTIGWSKDYSHPVTLTSVPVVGRGVNTAQAAQATRPAFHSNGTLTTAISSFTKPTSTGSAALSTPTATTTAANKNNVLGDAAEKVASAKTSSSSCGKKKRQPIKRHSDGGRVRPWMRARNQN